MDLGGDTIQSLTSSEDLGLAPALPLPGSPLWISRRTPCLKDLIGTAPTAPVRLRVAAGRTLCLFAASSGCLFHLLSVGRGAPQLPQSTPPMFLPLAQLALLKVGRHPSPLAFSHPRQDPEGFFMFSASLRSLL